MRLPMRREDIVQLARFAVFVEGVGLIVAMILGVAHAVVTRSRLIDSFLLMVFVPFLLLFAVALLSGPGAFLARPKFAPMGSVGRTRWRAWLSAPQIGRDQEFFDLVLYTGLAFLLLAIATGIGAVVGG